MSVAGVLLVGVGALTGCSGGGGGGATSRITVLEPLPVTGAVLTLGAGDALGRAVFISDIILAAAEQSDRAPVIVDAPVYFDLDADPR